jgi:hypothetical protein
MIILDGFASVFGSKRGIEPDLWREREFTALETRLRACGDEEAVALFYQHRGDRNPAAAESVSLLALRLAENAWFRWWHQGLDDALTVLGLGVHNFSPWLLSEESGVSNPFRRVIHLACIDFSAEWRALPDARNGYGLTVSLCGKDEHTLDTELNHRSFHHLPRGIWQNSLDKGARQRGIRGTVCGKCLQLQAEKNLAIPAVSEGKNAGARAGQKVHANYNDREFTRKSGCDLLALTARGRALLGAGDENIVSILNAEARSCACSHLATAVAADPIPVLMHLLKPRERAHLRACPQTQVQTRLRTLDWENALNACLQPQAELEGVQTLLRRAVADLN